MGLLEDAIANVLRPTVKATCGRNMRYHSAIDGQTYDVCATFTDATGETETIDGVTVSFHVQVFKIDRADLPVMPQRLDRLEWIKGDRTEWFRVLSDGAIDSVGPNDNFRNVWRISAKWEPSGDETGNPIYGNAAGLAYGSQTGVAHGGARR